MNFRSERSLLIPFVNCITGIHCVLCLLLLLFWNYRVSLEEQLLSNNETKTGRLQRRELSKFSFVSLFIIYMSVSRLGWHYVVCFIFHHGCLWVLFAMGFFKIFWVLLFFLPLMLCHYLFGFFGKNLVHYREFLDGFHCDFFPHVQWFVPLGSPCICWEFNGGWGFFGFFIWNVFNVISI